MTAQEAKHMPEELAPVLGMTGTSKASNEHCLQSPDHQHCNDWFDGGQCHYCGSGAMNAEERAAQGMEPAGGVTPCEPPDLSEILSGETMTQREEVCAAWADLPDDLRKDSRLTRLYFALGGPRMDDPTEASGAAA